MSFPIIGIGSSAGGLEPLQALIRAVPEASGLAFVIVAHLDPTQKSHLPELLARCTAMPVMQVEETTEVRPDHVYVIGPDQDLSIEGGALHTKKSELPRGHRHPVDVFFRSLAEDQGRRAIGIVLSGTGTNGSLGLRAIKAKGGIAIAQLPETASFQGMPRSAIGTGVVDLVLAPEQMPEALLDLARHPYVRAPKTTEERAADDSLKAVLSVVTARTRRDFTGYRQRTLVRRIHRRMGLLKMTELRAYADRLRQDPDETRALVADMTINVTGFFRDPEAWQTLAETVIAPLVRERDPGTEIRAWLPGCSTGEEAYSLGMLIVEEAERAGKSFDVKIFATDIAEGVLGTARGGHYPGSIALDVGEERLSRFFVQVDDSYTVRPVVRELVTFAPQDLLRDPPFSKLDLVSCRNVLIYLEPEHQKRLLALFHFALRPDGCLFLGSSENVSGLEDQFQPISKKWRIFRRAGPTPSEIVDFPLGAGRGSRAGGLDTLPAGVGELRARAADVMDRALLERHAPASALVDERYRIHFMRGPIDDYLKPPVGEPTFDLLAMAREGQQMALRTAIRRALDENREIVALARVRRGGERRHVRLVVTPLRRGAQAPARLLIGFFEHDPATEKVEADVPERSPGESLIQAELDNAREDLRLSVEQMESTNEELKASNEEIRSINEELQASNEELETSKEELQSLNEELNTVNSQLQAKVDELQARTDDLNNLLNSTDIATLFLDRSLCIRWFTPSMKALLELLPTDIGRPVSHFAQRFKGDSLVAAARRVLERLQPIDAEVQDEAGRWYIQHVLPFRTARDEIDGVIISFIDITERKRAEEERELLLSELNHRVKNILAVVQALVRQSDRRTQSVAAFRQQLVGRLQALARAHDLILSADWRKAQLGRLVQEAIEPFQPAGSTAITIDGEPLAISPRQALGLSFVLHELGTNAAKHGALAVPGGRLAIDWRVEGEPGARQVRLGWRESGGPAITPPNEQGFGTKLIERACAHELGGKAELHYAPDGLACEVRFPID
jgi:chemotaxis methyl-accepting protein methylase/two-component sensor histidine kinase/PAS domain-containing protein